MLPQLFQLPILIIAALAGGVIGSTASTENATPARAWLFGIAGAILATLIVLLTPWGVATIPVQGYGLMILVGFLTGIAIAARRARLIGVDPKHCVDLAVTGVIVGLLGARALHVGMYWPLFNPFHAGGFDVERVLSMFKLWEGGLVFFGTLIAILPYTYLYCKRAKIPPLPFLDLAIPSVFAGQAFGRIGCFLNGCCYGKVANGLPWGVQFPVDSPAYIFQRELGLIGDNARCSLSVHPTQIYASIAAALTAAFLYAYWPRRPYDGFIFSLALIMSGSMRFFEELLRTDEPALIDAVPFMTIAHWIAVALILAGVAMMFYFRARHTLYQPPAAPSDAPPVAAIPAAQKGQPA
jgi:phosphatidylglycerol---prolipoprotein diacylglyceryl transferase